MLKVLIVDDELAARRELRAQLGRFPHVRICGEAANAMEALPLIRSVQCNVVFLDIEMPGMNGVELARQVITPAGPYVVFITAYPKYAVDAFQVGAVGYLLKPFDEERLGQILERVASHRPGASRRNGDRAGVSGDPAPHASPRIVCERNGHTVLVHPREIAFAYILGEAVYVKLHQDRLHCTLNLSQLGQRLASYSFLRVHRRYLVNLEQVCAVIPYFKGSLALVVADADQTEVPVSRNMAPRVRQRLGLTSD